MLTNFSVTQFPPPLNGEESNDAYLLRMVGIKMNKGMQRAWRSYWNIIKVINVGRYYE